MNGIQTKNILEGLDDDTLIRVLLTYGHELTISARDSYEFQGPGVTKPRLLRDCNEIQHRVFQAINSVVHNPNNRFDISGIHHWISNDERDELVQFASMQAFERALIKCNMIR